eukprot:105428-Hanusia_phi.AAC.1
MSVHTPCKGLSPCKGNAFSQQRVKGRCDAEEGLDVLGEPWNPPLANGQARISLGHDRLWGHLR